MGGWTMDWAKMSWLVDLKSRERYFDEGLVSRSVSVAAGHGPYNITKPTLIDNLLRC